MRSLLRCPYCRQTAVIDKDGIAKASLRSVLSAKNAQAKRSGPIHTRKRRPADRWLIRASVFVGLLAVIVVLSLLAIRLLSSSPLEDPGTRQLYASARSFQTAFLSGDLRTAKSFVDSADQPRFEQWATPRYAAFVAGFGSRFTGRVTEVELIERNPTSATVRVRFRIQGREQQTFQTWRWIDTQWVLRLEEAASDT